MKRNVITPFIRLASLPMHGLSYHVDGDPPAIPDAVKAQIGAYTPEQFSAAFPKVFETVGTTAVDKYKAALPKPPDKYEVKLPEGSVLPAAVLERMTPAARELGIVSNENAQRLVALIDGEAKQVATRIAADYSPGGTVFETQRRQYEAAALSAPDLGNGSPQVLQAKVARVTAFTQKYFPEDVRKLINDTGVGNHPNFFRTMLKLADQMKEDGYVAGSTSKPAKSHAERIYGEQKEKTA